MTRLLVPSLDRDMHKLLLVELRGFDYVTPRGRGQETLNRLRRSSLVGSSIPLGRCESLVCDISSFQEILWRSSDFRNHFCRLFLLLESSGKAKFLGGEVSAISSLAAQWWTGRALWSLVKAALTSMVYQVFLWLSACDWLMAYTSAGTSIVRMRILVLASDRGWARPHTRRLWLVLAWDRSHESSPGK